MEFDVGNTTKTRWRRHCEKYASDITPIKTFQIYIEAKILRHRVAALRAILLNRHRRNRHGTRNFFQQRRLRITGQIVCQCANECITSTLERQDTESKCNAIKMAARVDGIEESAHRCVQYFFDFGRSHMYRPWFAGRSENRTVSPQRDDYGSTAQTQEIIYCTFRFSEMCIQNGHQWSVNSMLETDFHTQYRAQLVCSWHPLQFDLHIKCLAMYRVQEWFRWVRALHSISKYPFWIVSTRSMWPVSASPTGTPTPTQQSQWRERIAIRIRDYCALRNWSAHWLTFDESSTSAAFSTSDGDRESLAPGIMTIWFSPFSATLICAKPVFFPATRSMNFEQTPNFFKLSSYLSAHSSSPNYVFVVNEKKKYQISIFDTQVDESLWIYLRNESGWAAQLRSRYTLVRSFATETVCELTGTQRFAGTR